MDSWRKISLPLTGYKIKLVEKNGISLAQIIVDRDPYKGWPCGREKCVVCRDKPLGNREANCNKQNLTYSAICLQCKEDWDSRIEAVEDSEGPEAALELKNTIVTTEYVGESAKSLYKRGEQHLQMMNPTSFMMRHHIQSHPDQEFGSWSTRSAP